MSRSPLAFLAFLLVVTSSWSQAKNAEAELRAGLLAFQQEQYQQALQSFRRVIDEAAAQAPEAYFWSAKAYMATDMLDEADRALEHFLSRYPGHPLASEARYQKTRLLFLERDYENALLASYEFVRLNPGSPFVPNAYFWIGESLYSLGHLEEAERVFAKVLRDYPQSFKVEAASYRLSLIEFKKREEELLRLLKWSHEEFLRTVEEFQRREKSYEQALVAYQQRLAGGTSDQKTSDSKALEELKAENLSLRGKIQLLETQAQAASVAAGAAASEAASAAGEKAKQLADWEKALALKAEALALKESLLLRYERTEAKN
jgi:outer membrane protein assembly factor BamD (BamD/ComL family)